MFAELGSSVTLNRTPNKLGVKTLLVVTSVTTDLNIPSA